MTQMELEEKLMELETAAKAGGLSSDEIISAYELRAMAVQEEAESEDE